MPINRSEPDGLGHSSDARYHVFGTRTARCMSFATSGAPSLVNRPAITQLLLPIALSPRVVSSGPKAQCPEPKAPSSTPNAQRPRPDDEGIDVSCRGGRS